ncbi:MAG: hypothetical protein KC468_37940, partial [Myxococcales bacterium]|nr:hypothetical protein [Myxococcales bacterium]
RAPPAGFVSLRARAPAVRLDIRYHRADNFTGAPLPGYGAPGAWLTPASADALAAAQRELAEEGLGLVVFDAYRPTRASRAMVAWAEAHGREELLGDYVARRSGHARGHTVDVGLVSLKSGEPLDMGGEFDAFDRVSHTRAASGAALERRLRLRAAMQARGFAPYEREWWHFRHSSPGLPARDVPYGCDEDAPERRP